MNTAQVDGLDHGRLLEAFPEPAWIRDASSRRPLAVNAAALRLFDLTRDAFLNGLTDESPPPRVDGAQSLRLQVPGRGTLTAEAVVRTVDGAGRGVELVVVRQLDDPSTGVGSLSRSLGNELQREAAR